MYQCICLQFFHDNPFQGVIFCKICIFKTGQLEFQEEYNFTSVNEKCQKIKNPIVFLDSFWCRCNVTKNYNVLQCNAEIIIYLIFKIGKNHIQLLTGLVKT